VFVPGMLFHPWIMLVSKVAAYPSEEPIRLSSSKVGSWLYPQRS